MDRKRLGLTVVLLLLAALLPVGGEAGKRRREILYSYNASEQLRGMVQTLRDPRAEKVEEHRLARYSDYFVRISARERVICKPGKLANEALLGGRPFVFITTPESLYGRSLLDIYLNIGYEAEGVLADQQGAEMVAMVFRYPDHIRHSAAKDGRLEPDWQSRVIIPTWDNTFALFHRMAEGALIDRDPPPSVSTFRTCFPLEADRQFVLGFPAEGKAWVKVLSYTALRARGGAEWRYRELLESRLSAFEHFRGTGRTWNEVTDRDGGKPGLVEFVGPNLRLDQMAELVVLDVGRMTVKDTYFREVRKRR